MSVMEAGRSAGFSSHTEDEEDDFKKAIELSLLAQPEVVTMTFKDDKSETAVKDEQLLVNERSENENDDSIVVLTNEVPRNDTIEISDEYDSMCASTSTSIIVLSDTSPPEDYVFKKVKVDQKFSKPSIVIDSDESPPVKLVRKIMSKKVMMSSAPVPGKLDKKPVLTKQGGASAVVLQSQVGTAGTSSSRHLSCRFDTDTESDEEDEKGNEADTELSKHKVKKAFENDPPTQAPLSTEEVTARMRNVFESGLAIHFSGEEMEACKAVSTSLFPHQRVALAWMFRHENKESDGMWGGILADDMGLGKTLTVISLIMTNHWDSKPLAKPELGYVRPPFNTGQRGAKGKGKVGGNLRFKVSAEAVGVGSKLGKGVSAKKTTIGGLFDKFNDDDSEKENKSKFKFDKQNKVKTEVLKNRFIDDSSSNSDHDEDSDRSEDEFDKMSSNTDKFKASAKDLFKKKEMETVDDGYDDLSQDGIIMRPTAFDSKLNVDGFVDGSSSDDDNDKLETVRRLAASKVVKKRKLSTEEIKEKPTQEKRIKTVKPFSSSDGESDISLPDVSLESSTPSYKQKPKKFLKESPEALEPEKTDVNSDTGLKLIIPPKVPADRGDRRRATLLVCPASLIGHWVEQLQQHLHKSVNLRVKVHHGANKSLTGADLESYDIVITTYGTLAAEWGGGQVTPLTKTKWLRVVMDEGHNIKNHNSKSAKAAQALDTVRRWIVTGTPIQNNLMELWSLVNWLNFSMYCGKMKVFKQQIEGPCKKGLPRGFERLQVLMDTICLRRTKTDRKTDGSPLVVLPSKTIVTREVEMTEEERMCYAIYHKRAQEIVGRYHKKGQLLRNYAHVFALMMRLRQLCCHREIIRDVDWGEVLKDKEGLARQLEDYLDEDEVIKRSTGGADSGLEEDLERRLVSQLREMIRSGVSDDCSVCLDDLKTPVITPCAHVFCRTCIERVLDTMKPPSCPLCRNKIDNKNQLLEAGHDEDGEEKGESTLSDMEDIQVDISSSKVNAVLKEMLRIQRDCPDDKIVVVSQFTSFLSILQPLIKQNNFSLVRLDGTMSHFDRSETVSVFQSSKNNSPNVMLLSLKAGGVGLNLTAANHLLLLDPAWNPASEWQCFDRTHRLGQKKEVTIYKYITTDSIEEKMVEIQDKKKDLISGAFHMPADERRRQRVDDIINIFGI